MADKSFISIDPDTIRALVEAGIPYKPVVSTKNDGSLLERLKNEGHLLDHFKKDGNLLDRMVDAGIPFSRALKYFYENPEGSALETLKIAAEDVIPFYGSYRNGGDWKDYVQEAILMAAPMPRGSGKGRYKVRNDANGRPNMGDMQRWATDKLEQYDEAYRTARQKNPLDDLLETKASNERSIAKFQNGIDQMTQKAKLTTDPEQLRSYNDRIDGLRSAREQYEMANVALEKQINEAAINSLDRPNYKKQIEDLSTTSEGEINSSKYIYDKLVKEYGPKVADEIYFDLTNYDNPNHVYGLYDWVDDLKD